MNLIEHVADIENRLRALKAERPATFSQVRVFELSASFNITLQPFGSLGSTDRAFFQVDIDCSGTPFYSVALDDFSLFPVKIVPRNSVETVVGNHVTRFIYAQNLSAGVVTETVTPRAFALNGLSGTIVRYS